MALGTSEFLVKCVRGLKESGCVFQEIITLPTQLLPDNSIDLKDFAAEIVLGLRESKLSFSGWIQV